MRQNDRIQRLGEVNETGFEGARSSKEHLHFRQLAPRGSGVASGADTELIRMPWRRPISVSLLRSSARVA